MSHQQKYLFHTKCALCKREFHPQKPNQKYCDSICAYKAQRSRYPKKPWDKSQRKCAYCGKEFYPKNLKQKYCSNTCSLKSVKANYIKKPWDKSPKKCLICGIEFVPQRPNAKYCSRTCAKEGAQRQQMQQIRKWDKSPRKCLICGIEFVPQHPNNKYCSHSCQKEGYHSSVQKLEKYLSHTLNHRGEKKQKCLVCGKEFILKQLKRKYCSPKCRKEHLRNSERMRREIIKEKPNYTNFNGLLFWKEEEFEKWFRNNFALFGLKTLHKIDRIFPDVTAETYDGKILRIELELSALNFKSHKHDPKMCDLVISFVKPFGREYICGIPIIAIFNAKELKKGLADYAPESLELTSYFQKLVVSFNNNLTELLGKKSMDNLGTSSIGTNLND